ncbi:hypothetical protein WJX72_001607 [[Myrmecia] bisecta]|uniref:Rieske domain-containing protein n=1 Tax=[Myrmecia] bisecta TaxID=41462 RepID=A0AAW1PT61_9CHLO
MMKSSLCSTSGRSAVSANRSTPGAGRLNRLTPRLSLPQYTPFTSRACPTPRRFQCRVLERPVEQERAPASAQEGEAFSWTKNWYVVGVEADLDKEQPHAVTVLGGQFVLWYTNGAWHCNVDMCPHRLAPMSEGKIVDDSLQCSYHGWRFSSGPDGKCVSIPQAPANIAADTCENSATCLKSYPTRVEHGLVWIWPDGEEARFIEAAATAVAQDVPPKGSEWQEFLPLFLREFPYSYQTLFDNALDPSHVPWSHHGVIGDRTKVTPLEMEVVQGISPQGITTRFSDDGEAASAGADKQKVVTVTDLSFKAPHTLVYDLKRSDGTQGKLLAYCTPTEPGRCAVYSISLDTRRNLMTFFTSKVLPKWAAHMTFVKAGDGDIVLLKTQEEVVPRQDKGWRAFHMPTKADAMVSLWRRWLDSYASEEAHPYMLAAPGATSVPASLLSKEDLIDRYSQHTKHCKTCSAAMNKFHLYSRIATAVAALAAQLALLAALGVWNVQQGLGFVPAGGFSLGPLAVPAKWAVTAVATAVAALAAKTAKGFAESKQDFIYRDYVHAYI